MVLQRGLGGSRRCCCCNEQMQKFTWPPSKEHPTTTKKVHSQIVIVSSHSVWAALAGGGCCWCYRFVVVCRAVSQLHSWPGSLLWFNTLRSRCHSSLASRGGRWTDEKQAANPNEQTGGWWFVGWFVIQETISSSACEWLVLERKLDRIGIICSEKNTLKRWKRIKTSSWS